MSLPESYKSGTFVPESSSCSSGRAGNAGQMDRDDERLGEQYSAFGMRRCHQRDMFPFYLWLHDLCVVETKHAVRVIDEHVEMSQKVTAKNSANVRIGCLEMPEVLNDNQRVCYSVRTSFEYVQVRKRRTRAETDADEPGRTLNLQVKFSGQRRIDDGDLGACIHQKVIRAGVVDRDRNNDLASAGRDGGVNWGHFPDSVVLHEEPAGSPLRV